MIHKRHAAIGIVAGPAVILPMLLLLYFGLILHDVGMDRNSADPLYDLVLEADAMILGVAVFTAAIDAIIALGVGLLLALIDRRRRQRDHLSQMENISTQQKEIP